MNKTSSIWMAVLTLTAVILGAILLSSNERPAQAAMLNAQPNVTLMTTGNGVDEGLIVVDKTQQKMIIYLLKGADLVPIAGTNLGR
jgi:uncharacterized SAM-binding protein YcdF (DUF218 family)